MRRTEQVEATLRAVQNGHVSVEQLLRAALVRSERFSDWLEVSLSRWPDRRVRGPQLRRPGRLPSGAAEAALRAGRRHFAGRPGVLSVHWGMVSERSFYTGELGVVIFVERKIAKEELASLRVDARSTAAARAKAAPRIRPLPRSLTITSAGRKHHVRVDVQAPGLLAAPHLLAAFPGNRAGVRARDMGTLSAVVPGPDGRAHAVLAAHVAGAKGTAVTAVSFGGTSFQLGSIDRVHVPNDVAVTGPISLAAVAALAFPSTAPLRDPVKQDVGFSLLIFTPSGQPRQTMITDVGVPGDFTDGRHMEGLFATPSVTGPGDSGSPALDRAGSFLGFVAGASATKTYLVPARRAIDALFP